MDSLISLGPSSLLTSVLTRYHRRLGIQESGPGLAHRHPWVAGDLHRHLHSGCGSSDWIGEVHLSRRSGSDRHGHWDHGYPISMRPARRVSIPTADLRDAEKGREEIKKT